MSQPTHTAHLRAEQRQTQRVLERNRARVFQGENPPTERLLYLCGPMTGYPQYNRPAFEEAAAELRGCGYTVTSPAEPPIAQFPQTDWNTAIRGAVVGLLGCAGVATVTPGGIRQSRGASLEVHVAHELEMPVLYWQAWIRAADAWTEPQERTA